MARPLAVCGLPAGLRFEFKIHLQIATDYDQQVTILRY